MGNCFQTASQTVDHVETQFKYQTPTIVTGKTGPAPGELYNPYGVAIDDNTHQIFVVNKRNSRIVIFSESGEYIYQLGVGQLNYPYGVAIHGDSVYVSCGGDNTVSKFSLSDMSHVRRIGSWGSNKGQFNGLSQLTTDPIGRVFIADINNYRISVHDPDLNHLYNITLQSMARPRDVKVSRDRLYVLYPDNNPCMLVLTLEGDKLHSLITCGRGMDVSSPFFFCLDPLNNFVLSDHQFHSVCIFSPEGNLLHTIRSDEHERGRLSWPKGVAMTPNGRLVCVSLYHNYCLQLFSVDLSYSN